LSPVSRSGGASRRDQRLIHRSIAPHDNPDPQARTNVHREVSMQTQVEKKAIACARAHGQGGKPDDVLIRAIAAGSRPALELLYVRHRVRLFRFVLRLTGNVTLAEDAVSETFLDVWRTADRFQGRSSVSTWLFAIARHKALQALRSRPLVCLEDEEAGAAAVDDADDPETALNGQYRRAMIRRCLAQLPPAQRELLDLVYYHGKGIAEVAQIVGIPAGTVKSRMHDARGRIAALLRRSGVAEFAEC
jgi:RNA polymerase sigma-70 factor (ECF subfamily)